MNKIKLYIYISAIVLLMSCNASKFIPENKYLLESVRVESDNKELDPAMLQAYVRQNANSKWFSIFKIPLGTYSLAGKDSAKWLNRTLKNIGEKPVIYDTVMADRSLNDLTTAMLNMGYMHATAQIKTKTRGNKIKAIYMLHPGEPYYISSIKYDIKDSVIAKLLANKN